MNRLTFNKLRKAYRKKHYNRRQNFFLPAEALLEEKESLYMATYAIITISIVIVLLLIWAAFTTVEETAVTYGEITPRDKIKATVFCLTAAAYFFKVSMLGTGQDCNFSSSY